MAQATRTKLQPLHDRVLVKRLEEQDEKYGHIHIPDSAKDKPQEGKVIAVGTGRVTEDGKKLPLAVKEGDRILFGKYSGSEIKLDGTEYLIMKEEDVLAVSEGGTHHRPVGVKGKTKKKLVGLRGKTKNKKH